MLAHVEVLWVVKGAIETILNRVYHTWLQVNKKRSRDVMVIVSLVEKYILAILTLGCILFEGPVSTDAVLHA